MYKLTFLMLFVPPSLKIGKYVGVKNFFSIKTFLKNPPGNEENSDKKIKIFLYENVSLILKIPQVM